MFGLRFHRRRLFALVAVAATASLQLIAAPLSSAAAGLPYTDPNATGKIGFCNQDGQSVTHGSINDTPFVWRAVSSTPAPAPYNGTGRTAALFAYQPRPNVLPANWSGQFLTASANYTDPNHPMAAATYGDPSLATFISDFAPQVDGLLQVRIYLGLPDRPILNMKYSAASVRVTGTTWTLVDGGDVPCNSGTSTSMESVYLPPSLTSQSPTPSAPGSAASPSAAQSSGTASGSNSGSSSAASGSTRATSSPSASGSTKLANTSASRSSSGAPLALGLVGAVVALGAAAGGWFWWRRKKLP